MDENDFLKKTPAPEQSDSEKILEEVFGCPVADFIVKVKLELPKSQQGRVPFLLNKAMHLLTQEQLEKGAELAGDPKIFSDILTKTFEDYLQQ